MRATADDSTLTAVLKRDRLVVIAALVLMIVLAWAYILTGAGVGMSGSKRGPRPARPQARRAPTMTWWTLTLARAPPDAMQDMGMAAIAPMAWTPGYAVLMFFMWWIMMMAMMLPSATPMILLFALINRKQREHGAPYVPTGIFAAGYLLVWGAFSLVAVTAQWGLERIGLLSSMLASTSVLLGAGLLIAAGVYQFTPLKHACLRHCRSPISSSVTTGVRATWARCTWESTTASSAPAAAGS